MHAPARKYRAYTHRDLDRIPQLERFDERVRTAMKAVAAVLPFRTNGDVVEDLIGWEDVPDDPIFRLIFPQEGMLGREDLRRMVGLLRSGAPEEEVERAAREIQRRMNPHPAGQLTHNVPRLGERPLAGIQHKHRETVLFFPSQGQTCHAYCTYCFRWAQFVGLEDLRFASREAGDLVRYLEAHPEVTSVLFTGGDPLIMKAATLRRHVGRGSGEGAVQGGGQGRRCGCKFRGGGDRFRGRHRLRGGSRVQVQGERGGSRGRWRGVSGGAM
jgi:L-lysine 2,3-aminomutase